MSWYINVYEPYDIAILNIIGFDYRCIISLICEKENINLVQNADLTEKKEYYNMINIILKTKIKFHGDEVTDFIIKNSYFYNEKVLS